LDSLLSPTSRDVYTGSLARSVEELWPIITSPATAVAGAGVEGTFKDNFDHAKKLKTLSYT